MTADRDVTRIVRSWLEDGVTQLPDRVLDGVLDQIPATPQRRTGWSARRAQHMNGAFKMALAAAAVVAVVVAGFNFLPGNNDGTGGPGGVSPSPVVPASPAGSSSPQASPITAADRMSVAGSGLQATVELPPGWKHNEFVAFSGAGDSAEEEGMRVILSVVDNTFEDPCAKVERTPKVGPSVEAVARALGAIPETTATDPVQTTVAGYDATYLEITLPRELPCVEFLLWQDAPNGYWWALRPNEVVQVWILQVDRETFTIAASSWPETDAEVKAQFEDLLDSIAFDEPS